MKTLAVDHIRKDAALLKELMGTIDPEGSHETADSEKAAIRTAEELEPDVIWMGVDPPKLDGFDAAERIRRKQPDGNIIFVADRAEYALRAFELRASGYILKPVSEEQVRRELRDLRRPIRQMKQHIIAQCFGNFEAFTEDGVPIHFSRQKSKEALAYLIDRRGAAVTVAELCTALWEEREADAGLKAQCRVLMRSLKVDLQKIRAGDVIRKDWNAWSIDKSLVICDYYDFLAGDEQARDCFQGEYMTQYYWAEDRIGLLLDDLETD